MFEGYGLDGLFFRAICINRKKPVEIAEKIRTTPPLRPFIFLSAGILINEFIKFPQSNPAFLLILHSLILFFSFFFIFKKLGRAHHILAPVLFICAGFLLMETKKNNETYPGEDIYLAEITSLPEKKSSGYSNRLKIIASLTRNELFSLPINITGWFNEPDRDKLPAAGDRIILHTKVQPPGSPGNPNQFDYNKYLKRKNIAASCYIAPESWDFFNRVPRKFSLRLLAMKQKQRLLAQIESVSQLHHLNKDIMLAICLGDKSGLDKETRQSFADAGAVHIMAVSGLHAGMIWAFLSGITFFLRKKSFLHILRFLIILSGLWFFAIMTGLPASVVRSCLMFTLAGISRLIKRKSTSLNGLFIAGLILIIQNPYSLFDPGFQFSFLAVLSILIYNPLLSGVLRSSTLYLNKALSIISVSISAQILTFPLAILYFHQFPVYFILTNLLIIPLVTVLMTFFLIALATGFFAYFSNLMIHTSLVCGKIIEAITLKISLLPYSKIDHLEISQLQSVLLLLLSLFVLLFLKNKHKSALYISFCLAGILLTTSILKNYHKDKNQLCVFDFRYHFAASLFYNGNHIVLHNLPPEKMDEIVYKGKEYWLKNFTRMPGYFHIDSISAKNPQMNISYLPGKSNLVINLQKDKIAILGNPEVLSRYQSDSILKVSELILIACPDWQMKDALSLFSSRNLVLIPPPYAKSYADSVIPYPSDSVHIPHLQGAFLRRYEE